LSTCQVTIVPHVNASTTVSLLLYYLLLFN